METSLTPAGVRQCMVFLHPAKFGCCRANKSGDRAIIVCQVLKSIISAYWSATILRSLVAICLAELELISLKV